MNWANEQGISALIWIVGTLLLVATLGPAVELWAEDQANEDRAFFVAKGRVTYRVYCINCHGAKGKGDGALAEMLTTRPADLTQLKARNNDKYPADKVRDIIDGRGAVRAHGMQEMPVWGDVFQTSSLEPSGSDESAEDRSRRKIHELVLYLESIQE